MLRNQTIEKLQGLKLKGMQQAFLSQTNDPKMSELSFEERFGLIVDEEELIRSNRRMTQRLRQAKFKEQACFEDIEFTSGRGIDKSFVLSLAACEWVRQGLNITITGACGVGKTYLATALSHRACRNGYKVRYLRVPRLFDEVQAARADGSYSRLLSRLAKIDVIIFDDWGLSKIEAWQARELLEIIEDRHKTRSTIITSQLPTGKWYELIDDPTVADAIFDRLFHSSYKIELRGPSLRKEKSKIKNNAVKKEGDSSDLLN